MMCRAIDRRQSVPGRKLQMEVERERERGTKGKDREEGEKGD